MQAEVAELVDALGSGSSRQAPVGVRVPSSAPKNIKRAGFTTCPFSVLRGYYQRPHPESGRGDQKLVTEPRSARPLSSANPGSVFNGSVGAGNYFLPFG